jgi:hypothetical protein
LVCKIQSTGFYDYLCCSNGLLDQTTKNFDDAGTENQDTTAHSF